MSTTEQTKKQYSIKFLHSTSKAGLDRKFNKWRDNMNWRNNSSWRFSVEGLESITFQYGPVNLWMLYGVAILYRLEWLG
jgi:hypothetical protein